ncbi:hypothetical protein HHI36_012515 [Cryptolaemus montrouzieri]|uniref:Uncharacterized protein n=1 Tax=Cryptolaemus montrouzieri TaxID=559131 RepID=A0ABD2NET2_9CUCU
MWRKLINPRVTCEITSLYKFITFGLPFKTRVSTSRFFLIIVLTTILVHFAMKGAVFLCSVLALAASKPNGYYHQEYNYKSSSSSYKNNELQHQNEDQGFYSKDGDLEGRLKPKVNSHSQHSEYRNPKILGGSSNYQGAGDFSSGMGGNYASSDRLFGSNSLGYGSSGHADGYASSDRITELSNVFPSGGGYGSSANGYGNNQRDYGSTFASYGASNGGGYGPSQGGSSNVGYSQGGSKYGYYQRESSSSYGTTGYGANANLNSMAQRLQEDMSRQLENAIHQQYRSSGYSTSVSNSQMTADIRALEDELKRNLTRQVQESLRNQYGQQQTTGVNSYSIVEGVPSNIVNYNNQELADMTRQLEDNLIKKLHQDVRTTYTSSTNTYTHTPTYTSTYRPYYENPTVIIPTNIRYTPIPNPESITTIASRIQSNVNTYLDTELHNLYSSYLQSGRNSYFTLTDFDNEVNRIKSDMIRNLTTNLDDQIRRNYGQQILKNNYYYSISSTGQTSTQHNYNINDYNDLRKQIEENLLRKLNQTVNTYRDQYQRQQSYTTNTNTYTVTYRPTYYTSGGQIHDYSDLQRQLSQQLNNALNKHRYSQSSSYSSQTSYNPQAYQTSLDELTRELQRNLTQQLNNFRATSSSSNYGYTSGFTGGSADYESMKNQLQNQLMQQLQQGLQKQYRYSASASYSASSSSSSDSNYGTHQSYGNYGNYMACCGQSDDPTPYSQNRNKRDLLYTQSDSGNTQRRSYQSSTFSKRYSSGNSYSSLQSSSAGRYFRPLGYGSMSEQNQDQQIFSSGQKSINEQSEDAFPQVQQLEQTGQQLEDLAQQLELSGGHQHNLHHIQFVGQELGDDLTQKLDFHHQKSGYTNENEFTQKLELANSKEEEQHLVEQHLELQQPTSKHVVTHHFEFNHGPEKIEQNIIGQQIEEQDMQHSYLVEQNQQKGEHVTTHFGFNHMKPEKLEQHLIGQQIEDQDVQQLESADLQLPTIKTQTEIGVQQQVENLNNIHIPHQKLKFEQENIGQEQELVPNKPLILNPVQKSEINQQLQEGDLTQQLEIETQKPSASKLSENMQKFLEHEQVFTSQGLTQSQIPQQQEVVSQQLELDSQKLEGQNQQTIQELNDLNQQLEIENKPQYNKPEYSQQTQDDITQQLEIGSESQYSKPKYSQPTQGDITQQLEIGSKPKYSQQTQDDITQQLERGSKPQYSKPKYSQQAQDDITQQLEIGSNPQYSKPMYSQQTQDDITQQLEIGSKPQYDKQIYSQQTQDDITQQLEIGSKPKYSQQAQDDITQQLEIGSKPQYSKQTYSQQTQDDITQQLEIGSKPQHNKPKYSQQTQDDITQQLETESKQYSKPKYSQQTQNDITQQLERQSKPQYSKPMYSQQTQSDITQQSEMTDSRKPKLTLIGQQLENQDQISESQVEDQQLMMSNAQKPKNGQHKFNQEQFEDDLSQQLELSGKHKPSEKPYTEGQALTNDVTQQLEQQLQTDAAQTNSEDSIQQKLEPNQFPEQEQKLEISNTHHLETVAQQVDDSLKLNTETSRSPKHTYKVSEIDHDLDQQLELTDSKKIKDHSHQSTTSISSVTERLPIEDLTEVYNTPEAVDVNQHLGVADSKHEQTEQKIQTTNQFGTTHISLKPLEGSENGLRQESQYPTSSHRIIIHRTNPLSHDQDPIIYSKSELEQRTFTNGHSGHTTGQFGTYQDALRQQDALIDLLKQKTHREPSNQVTYGQRTIKKTVYVNGKPVSSSENIQILKPNGEIVESGNTLPLNANTFGQNSLDSYLKKFGENSQQVTSSKTSSYSGSTIQRATHHVPSTYGSQWPTYNGRQIGGHFSNDFATGQFGHEIGTPQFTGKTTRRVIHLVNGKAVSASEKTQIIKPNGQIIESNHDLPLDDNLLVKDSHPQLSSSDPLRHDSSIFSPIGTYFGHSGETIKPTMHVQKPTNLELDDLENPSTFVDGTYGQQVGQHSNRQTSSHRSQYDVKRTRHFEINGY